MVNGTGRPCYGPRRGRLQISNQKVKSQIYWGWVVVSACTYCHHSSIPLLRRCPSEILAAEKGKTTGRTRREIAGGFETTRPYLIARLQLRSNLVCTTSSSLTHASSPDKLQSSESDRPSLFLGTAEHARRTRTRWKLRRIPGPPQFCR